MNRRPEQETRGERTEGCCTSVPDVSMEEIEADVAVLAALSNRTRYGALRVLAAADGEVCACDLAPPLDASQSAISHALSKLHDAGLVDRRKQGRWRYYRITPLAESVLAVFDEHGTSEERR